MRCYFLRHGHAVDAERWSDTDETRPLTREGRERMAREAKTIAALNLGLDAIVTSPLVRAKQTAEIVAGALKMPIDEDARLGIGFNVEALRGILSDRRDAGAVMLVGHEPGMSLTIGAAIGEARIELKKGALACVAFSDVTQLHGELSSLVPPKVLAH